MHEYDRRQHLTSYVVGTMTVDTHPDVLVKKREKEKVVENPSNLTIWRLKGSHEKLI